MQNFKSAVNLEDAKTPDWLLNLRKRQWRLAQEQGLPTSKIEKWRYNKLKDFQKDYKSAKFVEFNSANQLADFIEKHSGLNQLSAIDILQLLQNSFANIVFVNGFFSEKLSKIPQELNLTQTQPNLATVKIENQNYPSLRFVEEKNQLEPLHLALLQNFINFSLEKSTQAPLIILHLNSDDENQATSTGWQLELKSGVTSEIIELELGSKTNLNLILRNIILQDKANLNLNLYNSTPSTSVNHSISYIKQEEKSQFNLQHLNLSEGWTRADFVVDLLGEKAETNASGVFFGKEKSELDLHFQVKHLAGKTNSKQLYKYILDDRATGIFNSGVFVARDSQKIDSMQRSANLLISDKAKMNAKPELEIYADDVKCAHGASTGTLDEEAMFALRTRGLNKEDAKNLLTLAFANQVLQEISNKNLRNLAEAKIYKDLGDLNYLDKELGD